MGFSFSKAALCRSQSINPSTAQKVATNTRRRLSPVEIPELLEIVFSYVDNYTLRMCVVGVCRQWFLMNRHRVFREVVWDIGTDPKSNDVLMSRLLGAGRLWWYSRRHSTMVFPGVDHWEALVKALKKNSERDLTFRQQQQQRKQCGRHESVQNVMEMRPLLYSSLQDLELVDYVYICSKLGEILPYLSTLTRLRLQIADNGKIWLSRIFSACPLLESFEVDAKNYVEFPSPWVVRETPQERHQRQQQQQEGHTTTSRRQLPLQSFILRNGHFAQPDLESLLAITPRLQELKLITLRSGIWIEQNHTDLTQISASTMAYLKTHKIALRSFHLSLANTSLASSQCSMFLVTPQSTDWTFSTQDLSPVMVKQLQETLNVVTRLEIHHQDRAKLLANSGLHEYLCMSPHLLHLKAPYAAYLLEYMDVHSRANLASSVRGTGVSRGGGGSGDDSGSAESTLRGRVWACRNLQSLHLGTHPQHGFPYGTKVHSRIVYGYLTSICPNIRDLRIDPYYHTALLPRPILFMDLDAGMCLLSRLRYLETLLIGSAGMTTASGSRDLTWMVASGWTAEARREREKTMGGWKTRLLEETQQNSRTSLKSLEGPYVDSDLVKSLQHLGLLEDVKNTLDRMGEKVESGEYCWPLLQRLSINRPIELGRAPETELRRLFPTS
ncbi:hypothetical protein BGX24_004340, partial [Mortierella sp. AD032]